MNGAPDQPGGVGAMREQTWWLWARDWAEREGAHTRLEALLMLHTRLRQSRLSDLLEDELARLPPSVVPVEDDRRWLLPVAAFLARMREVMDGPREYGALLDLLTVHAVERVGFAHVGRVYAQAEPMFAAWAQRLGGEGASALHALDAHGRILPRDPGNRGPEDERGRVQQGRIDRAYGEHDATTGERHLGVYWLAVWARNDYVHGNRSRLEGLANPSQAWNDVLALLCLAALRYHRALSERGVEGPPLASVDCAFVGPHRVGAPPSRRGRRAAMAAAALLLLGGGVYAGVGEGELLSGVTAAGAATDGTDACAELDERMIGDWRLVTRVEGANPERAFGIGARGRYDLKVRQDRCELVGTLSKLRFANANEDEWHRAGRPTGTATFARGRGVEDGSWQSTFRLESGDGRVLRYQFALSPRDGGLAGVWRNDGWAWNQYGYWGILRGAPQDTTWPKVGSATDQPCFAQCRVHCRVPGPSERRDARVESCVSRCQEAPGRAVSGCSDG